MSLLRLGFCLLVAVPSLWAQDDKAKLKADILKKVEETIRGEEARILKNIEALLDKELGQDAPAPKPASGRGFLGIRAVELSQDERDELKLKADDGGIKIAEILPDGAADGKLETDDIILKIDGEVIKNVDGLIAKIQKMQAGADVTATILRENKRQEVKLKLGVHPDEQKKEEPKKEEPKKEEPKKEEKQDLGKNDLKDRIKKFLDTDSDLEKKLDDLIENLTKGDQFQGLVDEMRSWIEKMGINPDQFFEMEDGKWKPTEQYKDLFKMVPGEMEKYLEQFRGKKPEAKKEEPKKAVRKPYLGILVEELSDDERRAAKLEEGTGLLVSGVREGSPAEKAGVKQGDILKSIGKDPTKGEKSMKTFMSQAKAGEEVELTLVRDGKEMKVKVVLDERKDQ